MRSPVRVVHVSSSAALLLVFFSSCAARVEGDVRVGVAPALVFPAGVLDAAASLEVSVFNASDGVSCDAASGRALGVTASTRKVGSGLLGESGCAAGARFCGTFSIQKDPGARIFAALARTANGDDLAAGCAAAKVDEDTLSVRIEMVRAFRPDVCGDGRLGPTEQCEPAGAAGDFACDASCHSREALVSNPFALAPTPSGRAGYAPAFAWTAQGPFFAFFTVKSGATTQVAMRALSDAFEKLATPAGARDAAFLLPTDASFPPLASEGNLSQPAVATIGDTTYVAFTDDADGTPDIHLRSFDPSFVGREGARAVGINGSPNGTPQRVGEPGVQEAPAVAAGPGGAVLVAWQDTSGPNAGKILARTFTPGSTAGSPGSLGSEVEISLGTQNRNVRVATAGGRWLVVWESGNDVKLRVVDANGTPSGGELVVNEAGLHLGAQEHPSIAVLPDGRVAVAWTDRGAPGGADVFVQRYDASLVKVPGDQAARINGGVVAGDQLAPSIAATTGAGGSFVVAWLDAATSNVRARFLGWSGGFLFNNVDGQSGEFQASVAAGRKRANPVVAAGGAGHVVVGWDDVTGDATSGTYGRRFPLPTQ
jgi:hypothetical protein